MDRSIKALLFSDIKGYSNLNERECLIFCKHFHSQVYREVLAPFEPKLLTRNSWGDALHIVMDDIVSMGKLALELRDWMSAFDWGAHGLKQQLQIRIGLHVGVVTKVSDPILQGFNYVGRNTSKAARIEPITYEGQIFVSQAYAALLAPLPHSGLHCEYVGVRELPKNAGLISVYLLHRAIAKQINTLQFVNPVKNCS